MIVKKIEMNEEGWTLLSLMAAKCNRNEGELIGLSLSLMGQAIEAVEQGMHVGASEDGSYLDIEWLGILNPRTSPSS